MTVRRPALTCYRCGHHYDYLGESNHPGQCPACESRAVSPAGDFVVDGSQIDHDKTPPVVRLQANDASDRVFRFSFELSGETEVSLRRLLIENTLIRSPDGTWPGAIVTDEIRAELRDAGYSLTKPQ